MTLKIRGTGYKYVDESLETKSNPHTNPWYAIGREVEMNNNLR